MGAVLEFRRDSGRVSRISKKRKTKEDNELGQIIIFPGIRRERHYNECDDYLSDDLMEDQENDTQNAG